MLSKICILLLSFVILSIAGVGQTPLLRGDYSRITPYVSTLEDVSKIFGAGQGIFKEGADYSDRVYEINANVEMTIGYVRSCNCNNAPKTVRKWIVDSVFFSFDDGLKLKPDDIFMKASDFTACPYGDIAGQVIYFNKDRNINITYMSLAEEVRSVSISATDENKKKVCCNQKRIEWSLDPSKFRCAADSRNIPRDERR